MLIRCIYCSVSVQLMSILRRSLNVFSEKATTSSSTTPQSAFFMNRSYYCCCALIQPSASAPGVLRFVLYGATYLSKQWWWTHKGPSSKRFLISCHKYTVVGADGGVALSMYDFHDSTQILLATLKIFLKEVLH